MAYHFKRQRAVAAEIRRLARERIDMAMRALRQACRGHVEGVHSARKRLKELRAILRLVQYPLGACYSVENHCYRDAGRELAPLRDVQVLRQNWDALAAKFPELTGYPIYRHFEQCLEQRLNDCRSDELPIIQSVLKVMGSARQRVGDWPLNGLSFDELIPGLARTYKLARNDAVRACHTTDGQLFHECRKRTKDLWCHTTLFERTSPNVMHIQSNQLKRMLSSLGQDHDLTVLQLAIYDFVSSDGDIIHRLIEQMKGLQRDLRTHFCKIATGVYRETPKKYVCRLSEQWVLWGRC